MKKNLFITSVLLLTFSCGMPNKTNLEFDDSGSAALDPDMQVSFGTLREQILAPKCINCHSDASTEQGIQGWVTPGNPEGSALFVKTENGSMPKNGSPLSTRDLELIRMYIEQLAASPAPEPSPVEPVPAPTPTPPTGNPGVTFAEIKSKILQPYSCTSCHSVGTEAALSKWLNKTTGTSSKFYTITKSGTMPENGPRVNSEDMQLILQYVKDYAARN